MHVTSYGLDIDRVYQVARGDGRKLVTKPHFRHDGVDVVTSVTCQLAMSHHIQA